MYIDTHTHLYLKEFDHDRIEMMRRAKENGVQKMYLPAIDSETHDSMINMEHQFQDACFAMMGLHPCYVKENFHHELDVALNWLEKKKFAAIGECGLDFYWDKTFINQQYEALQQQIDWAVAFNLPIVLHTRNATRETIEVIRKNKSRGLTGIFHCFGGTVEEAIDIIELGFYLGIGGVVTYKNSGLDQVLTQIDLQHIVLETDAPYLSPVPFRGKRNESSFLVSIAEKIALLKNTTAEEVGKITTSNAMKIFRR